MPGLSHGDDPRELRLADAVAYLTAQIEQRDLTDVVLVGHSWGGIPMVGAAPRLAGRLRRMAFVSAFVPRSGESMAEAMGPEVGAYMRAEISASPDHTISVAFDAFCAALMPDEPQSLQRLVYSLLLPQPGGYMLDALEFGDLTALNAPVTYLLAEQDRALAYPDDVAKALCGAAEN